MDAENNQFMSEFDERQRKQILWAQSYDTSKFRHGDSGHNDKIIISKLTGICRHYEALLKANNIPVLADNDPR